MFKRFDFGSLICFALIWPGSLCLAQPVTIRVIDVHDGHPLQKEQVSLNLLYEREQKKPASYESLQTGVTDASGEVQFQIPDPAPAHFSAMVHLTTEYLICGCWVLGTTQDLLQKGIIGPVPSARSEKSDVALHAAPALILILARPMSFWERLFYPIMKE
jgi:hypothetical protein